MSAEIPGLVSVIIPAFNAAATLPATLASVSAQSWHRLEILVVDDGSRDATGAIAQALAAQDGRLRVIAQANGGLAAARNRGIAEACGEYLAPVDADDLWAPDKIERQVQAMREGGPRVGLVYTWNARIDEHDRLIDLLPPSHAQGDVRRALAQGNIVGNGSCPLMRRAAVLEAGGYDPGLRAQRAQGCEDYKLYFAIALRHHFAVVEAYLTGYRRLAGSMSRDSLQMLRSYDLVVAPLLLAHPDLAGDFHAGRGHLLEWLYWESLHAALASGWPGDVQAVLRALIRHERRRGLQLLRWLPRTLLREGLDRLLPPRRARTAAARAIAPRFPGLVATA